jgi:hypothetical protein
MAQPAPLWIDTFTDNSDNVDETSRPSDSIKTGTFNGSNLSEGFRKVSISLPIWHRNQ